jgi:hypothetical protein
VDHAHEEDPVHRTTMIRGRRTSVLLTTAVVALGLAACSPGPADVGVATADDTPTSTDPAKTDEERNLEFTRCLGEQGVTVEDDPDGLDSGSGEGEASSQSLQADADVDIERAMEACASYAPAGEQVAPPTAAELETFRAHSACMRKNGIDMPDPDPQTGIADPPDDVDDDALFTAYDVCSSVFDEDGDS